MTVKIAIKTEDDPAFIVLVFAEKFRRFTSSKDKQAKLLAVNGCFALSFSDGQSLTITAKPAKGNRKDIYLERGVSKSACPTIHINSEKPDASPRIQGLWRHPILTMKVGTLLQSNKNDIESLAGEFWLWAKSDNACPGNLTVNIIDMDKTLHFTNERSSDALTISGNAIHILEIFSGEGILVLKALSGAVTVDATTRQIAEFSRLNITYMTGWGADNES